MTRTRIIPTPTISTISIAAAMAACSSAAFAQSSVALYGTVDQYVSYLRSSSGEKSMALEDGALTRTRWGLRGSEDLGAGRRAIFQLEAGASADDGRAADSSRLFDRQAWVGLGGGFGEVRVGRQNTVVVGRGSYVDHTARTLGSVLNAFGIPARYDNDVSYISPRVAGFLVEAHYALAETPNQSRRQSVKQVGVDYETGPYRLGYVGVTAGPRSPAAYTANVQYQNLYANYDYGQGKIYLAYARSNNSTATGSGNNAGSILSNVGGVVDGSNADVNRMYNLWQISADYRATPQFRVGALFGLLDDRSGNRSASGASVAGFYDLSKRTTLYTVGQQLRNRGSAGFRPAGSAGLKSNFSMPNDVNGRTITGLHAGILHRF
jgi:predicted porin